MPESACLDSDGQGVGSPQPAVMSCQKVLALTVMDKGFDLCGQRSSRASGYRVVLQWLCCRVPGMIGSLLGLVGLVSVYSGCGSQLDL